MSFLQNTYKTVTADNIVRLVFMQNKYINNC